MKKIFIALVALVASMSVQSVQAQLLNFDGMPLYRLGVFGGLNVPSFSDGAYSYSKGVQGGLDFMLSGDAISEDLSDAYLRTDLMYSMKGALYKGETDADKVHFTTHYLEIPIHVGYAWAMTDQFSFLAETGPYVAWGLGGTARPDGASYGESITDYPFFKHYDASHFDFGWGVRAGVLFKQVIELYVGHEWGFKNVAPEFRQNTNFSAGLVLYFDYK